MELNIKANLGLVKYGVEISIFFLVSESLHIKYNSGLWCKFDKIIVINW